MQRYWLAILLVSGCAAHGYRFTTDHRAYHPGQALEVMLTNYSPRNIGHNLCLAELQRHEGAHWIPQSYWVPTVDARAKSFERIPQEDVACLAILRDLGPWGRRHMTLGLNDDIAPGEYRIRTSIEWGRREFLWLFGFGASGASQVITTPPFTVSRP
ncbi:MAG TPA: hypothetical protein VHB97_17045 [Polyangia bacterium]|jgi:hypothetical protein|nr:hypothetical protein [Polyangia bacterium]